MKKNNRSSQYTIQTQEHDAPHFKQQIQVHMLSLIEVVLCYPSTFRDVITFNAKNIYKSTNISFISFFSQRY